MKITLDCAIVFALLYITFITITGIVLVLKNKELNIEKYRIDIKYGYDPSLEEQLNKIIESVFEEYRFYNLEYKDDSYVKETDEKKIIQDICEMVIQRISPVFITRLSTYFNTDSLGEIIAVKISTKVMEYRVMRNIQGEQTKNKGE